MSDLQKSERKKRLLIFSTPAIVSIIFAFWKFGFGVNYWIVVILWIVIYIIFFVKPTVSNKYAFRLIIFMTFIFTILISLNVIFVSNSAPASDKLDKSADGIILADCTSAASDAPVMVSGWKSTIYAAPLESSSPDVGKANDVRTFSYKGIKNKTESNSLYSRIEKTDGSYITGYGTTMEACSSDNKTSLLYTTADTDYVASDNVVASVHYLHGGSYLHGAGDYRVDVYLKTTDGKWHLIDRMNGIKVTE